MVEVAESHKLKTFEYTNYKNLRRVRKPLESGFCKYMFVNSEKIGKKQYKRDIFGRMYRNKEVHKLSLFDEFVADESFVKPRYIISMEVEHNEEMFDCIYDLMIACSK